MKISIITPHYNDIEGIKQTYECLKKQTSEQWEWIIVDDCSTQEVKNLVQDFIYQTDNASIKLFFNQEKTNASICRNLGIDYASHSTLVFLDSDDIISEDFVTNRLIKVEEFIVFRNFNILNEKGENIASSKITTNFLDHFLRAEFAWQTTGILWNKSFLVNIGKFNSDLQRLQDVELSIRALFLGKKYRIIDNKVAFFYNVSPIRNRKNFVKKVSVSVNYLITKIHADYKLNAQQQQLIKGYYYLCVKYLHRSKSRKDVKYVRENLNLFYSKKYVKLNGYLFGLLFLNLYKFRLISDDFFLKLNRYFYK